MSLLRHSSFLYPADPPGSIPLDELIPGRIYKTIYKGQWAYIKFVRRDPADPTAIYVQTWNNAFGRRGPQAAGPEHRVDLNNYPHSFYEFHTDLSPMTLIFGTPTLEEIAEQIKPTPENLAKKTNTLT